MYKLAVEILPLLKKYKAARFKYFDDFESAKNFAENGSEGDPTWSSDALLAEKRSALNLRSISREEFQLFKKYLEDCNVSKVQELVTLNPRYLVGSCSFPCILKVSSPFKFSALIARMLSFLDGFKGDCSFCMMSFRSLYKKEMNF